MDTSQASLWLGATDLRTSKVRWPTEWTNADWTKNKSVTIEAVSSDDPYTCVASDIPGGNDYEQTGSHVR